MKKILLIALIAFSLVATGSAMAWRIDIEAHVSQATMDLQASATGTDWDDDSYLFATTAGVDGTGKIDIFGQGYARNDQGKLETEVWSRAGASMYATQTLMTEGCLVECPDDEPCYECPDYVYGAGSGATIDGTGSIYLGSGENVFCGKTGQILTVHGEGDFTAGMTSTLWVDDLEPVSHTMGAFGENVDFCAFGIQGIDNGNGANNGFFTATMSFQDDPCPGETCDDDDCDPCYK